MQDALDEDAVSHLATVILKTVRQHYMTACPGDRKRVLEVINAIALAAAFVANAVDDPSAWDFLEQCLRSARQTGSRH